MLYENRVAGVSQARIIIAISVVKSVILRSRPKWPEVNNAEECYEGEANHHQAYFESAHEELTVFSQSQPADA